MKKIIVIGTALLLAACSEKPPLMPEQQWQGFCTSLGNAARSIMLDRQSGIDKARALEHANRVEDPLIKEMILKILDQAYLQPRVEGKQAKLDVQEKFKQQAYEQCLSTPHDRMPQYKKL